jgi:hypothetical protein
MLIISHRGNIEGKDPKKENNPEHIYTLLTNNINCEIDVWYINNEWYLGHDTPDNIVSEKFLQLDGLWCHCKNLPALVKIQELKTKHFFWHQKDSYTLTSSGYIWTYPDTPVDTNCIIVDNTVERKNKKYNCFAVCTDYIY